MAATRASLQKLRQLKLLSSVSCILLKVAFAHSGLQCIKPRSCGHKCHLLMLQWSMLPVQHGILLRPLQQGTADFSADILSSCAQQGNLISS